MYSLFVLVVLTVIQCSVASAAIESGLRGSAESNQPQTMPFNSRISMLSSSGIKGVKLAADQQYSKARFASQDVSGYLVTYSNLGHQCFGDKFDYDFMMGFSTGLCYDAGEGSFEFVCDTKKKIAKHSVYLGSSCENNKKIQSEEFEYGDCAPSIIPSSSNSTSIAECYAGSSVTLLYKYQLTLHYADSSCSSDIHSFFGIRAESCLNLIYAALAPDDDPDNSGGSGNSVSDVIALATEATTDKALADSEEGPVAGILTCDGGKLYSNTKCTGEPLTKPDDDGGKDGDDGDDDNTGVCNHNGEQDDDDGDAHTFGTYHANVITDTLEGGVSSDCGSSSSSDDGLSDGAIAGIVVGSVVGGGLVIGGIAYAVTQSGYAAVAVKPA